MGALDNGFRLSPAAQPVDGDVLVYDAATDSVRAGGAIPAAVGVTTAAGYSVSSGSVEAGTSLGSGATEIDTSLRVEFTAPASGRILIEMSGWVETAATAGTLYWYPRTVLVSTSAEVSKPSCRAAFVGTGASQTKGHIMVRRILAGLTAGAAYRIEWQHAATIAGFFIKPDSAQGQIAVLAVTTLPA